MAAPSIQLDFGHSLVDGELTYLRCAPPQKGGAETGFLNLDLVVKYTGSNHRLVVERIELSVPPGQQELDCPTEEFVLSRGSSRNWVPRQGQEYLFAIPKGAAEVRLRVFAHELDSGGAKTSFAEPAEFTRAIVAHKNPTPFGSYRFFGAVGDLRPGEFWQLHGTSHAQDNPSQIYAYDVGVAVESGSGYDLELQRGAGEEKANHHYRIWGKPIYAVADGVVVSWRNDFPDNPRPGEVDPETAKNRSVVRAKPNGLRSTKRPSRSG